MVPRETERSQPLRVPAQPSTLYGEGFAASYASSRYTSFSRFLARLALAVIARHEAPGLDVLDLACGVGAGSLVFAEAGYRVSGVDASPVMVRIAEERANARGVPFQVRCQDMRALDLAGPYDVVTCLFDALNYLLESDELGLVFSQVAGLLRPGGLFVFDMNTPHGLSTRWGTKDTVATIGSKLMEVNQHRYDTARQINVTTTTIFARQGETDLYHRSTEVHRQRGYPIQVIRGVLEAAGLAVLSIQGLADGLQGLAQGLAPMSEDMGRVVIAARKGRVEGPGLPLEGGAARAG